MLNGDAAPLTDFHSFDFASRRAVLAAVSGGSDSTALLLLLKDHLARFSPGTRLVAATVDHRLRPGSSREADAVARLCAAHGIAHRTFPWLGEKPATGLAAAARDARYRLLTQAADHFRTDLLVTGHTADDQAETVTMRRERRSTRGLAGMAPATLHQGRIWILRPLLAVRREALRDYLRNRASQWIDDPTNSDLFYERSRVRAQLGGPGGDAIATDALAAGRDAARFREDLGVRAAELIREHATRPSPGLVRLAPDFAAGADREAVVYALRILLAVTGGRTQIADADRTAALLDRVSTVKAARGVLSRTLVDASRAGVTLHREARSLPDIPLTQPWDWDGRYRIAPEGEEAGLRVAALGEAQARRRVSMLRSKGRAALGALAAEPALWSGDRCIGPMTGEARWALVAPWAQYLPSFDLAPARAAWELVEAGNLPEPPCPGHIELKA